MTLKKLAHIQLPEPRPDWMKTHLANPIARALDDAVVRIYCNVRNQANQSQIIYLDIDFSNDFAVTYFHQTPLLTLGTAGSFDDSGQSLGCLITENNQDYLYYLGWNLAPNVPFRNSIGLAASMANTNTFKKISEGPILDRNTVDPFCLSYPFVLKHEGKFKMWYGSHSRSGATVRDVRHGIKYAESTDLIHWQRSSHVCIDASETEIAFTRPFVMVENNRYKMWYSYLQDYYRIGYAESADGRSWTRLDNQAGIDVSNDGWDAEMIAYPFILDFKDNRYLIYCGNKFGETGFGIAQFT